MANVWMIILAVLIFFGGFPFLGKLIYKLSDKQGFLVYLLTAIIVGVVTALLAIKPDQTVLASNYDNLRADLFSFFSLNIILVSMLGGFGIIGGTFEKLAEWIENTDQYRIYHKLSPIKIYICQLFYGYFFAFAVYSAGEMLVEALMWTFSENLNIISDIFDLLGFNSRALVLIGFLLYCVKSSRFGFFTLEFYKSEYAPEVIALTDKKKEFHRIISIIIGVAGSYFIGTLHFLDNYPNTHDPSYQRLNAVFSLCTVLFAFVFLGLKHKIVDQLKPKTEEYKKVVNKQMELPKEQEEKEKDEEDYIRFF